jgi:hypothetical protein
LTIKGSLTTPSFQKHLLPTQNSELKKPTMAEPEEEFYLLSNRDEEEARRFVPDPWFN